LSDGVFTKIDKMLAKARFLPILAKTSDFRQNVKMLLKSLFDDFAENHPKSPKRQNAPKVAF